MVSYRRNEKFGNVDIQRSLMDWPEVCSSTGLPWLRRTCILRISQRDECAIIPSDRSYARTRVAPAGCSDLSSCGPSVPRLFRRQRCSSTVTRTKRLRDSRRSRSVHNLADNQKEADADSHVSVWFRRTRARLADESLAIDELSRVRFSERLLNSFAFHEGTRYRVRRALPQRSRTVGPALQFRQTDPPIVPPGFGKQPLRAQGHFAVSRAFIVNLARHNDPHRAATQRHYCLR